MSSCGLVDKDTGLVIKFRVQIPQKLLVVLERKRDKRSYLPGNKMKVKSVSKEW